MIWFSFGGHLGCELKFNSKHLLQGKTCDCQWRCEASDCCRSHATARSTSLLHEVPKTVSASDLPPFSATSIWLAKCKVARLNRLPCCVIAHLQSMPGRELCRRYSPYRAMRPCFVVIAPPVTDDGSGMRDRMEVVMVQIRLLTSLCRDGRTNYCGIILAARITLPHFSISDFT